MLTQKKTKAIMLGDTPVKRVMFRDKQIWPELGPAPTNLVGVAGTLKATLTWTSATGESGVTWTEEKLVRKEGSAPQGSMDGTVVTTITTKDTYASTGYEDTRLDSTKTYYYKVFAVYDNGTEKGSSDVNVTPDGVPTESIMIKMMAGNDGTLKVPVAGYSTGGNKNCPYNWNVSVDGGTPIAKSGTGSRTPLTIATGLTAGSDHTVMITPVSEAYGWARAFGFESSGISDLLKEVIYDGSYKGYGLDATDTGNHFKRGVYYGCTNLTFAPAEVLPNTVTRISHYFRASEFHNCSKLTSIPNEALPNSVTLIESFFRASEFEGCVKINTTPTEAMSTSISSIGTYYRSRQFHGCVDINEIQGIQATPSSIGHEIAFRNYQFTNAGNTTTPMTLTINGSNIETGQTNSLGLADANVAQIKVDASLITAYQNSSLWSNITDSKFVAL